MLPSIAIIDDSRQKRNYLTVILEDQFTVHPFESGKQAMPMLHALAPQCILLDVAMPDEDGFQVIARLKDDPVLAQVPVMFITALTDPGLESRGLKCGAVDFVGTHVSPDVIRSRVRHHVELYGYRLHLEERVEEKTRIIQELQDALIMALSDLVECRDTNTAGHAQRTSDYVARIVEQLITDGKYTAELTKNFVQDLVRAAPLHDIGKVGVKDALLNKPGRLTREEFEEMKKHTVFGATAITKAIRVLHDNSFLKVLRDMALSHHERWDGSGYPLGLSGENIPLSGRLLAIADVYDALVSVRPYKKASTHAEAVEIIRNGSGNHFDPLIATAFLRCEKDFQDISLRYR